MKPSELVARDHASLFNSGFSSFDSVESTDAWSAAPRYGFEG